MGSVAAAILPVREFDRYFSSHYHPTELFQVYYSYVQVA